MAHELKDLSLDEVSWLPKDAEPANAGARVLLLKTDVRNRLKRGGIVVKTETVELLRRLAKALGHPLPETEPNDVEEGDPMADADVTKQLEELTKSHGRLIKRFELRDRIDGAANLADLTKVDADVAKAATDDAEGHKDLAARAKARREALEVADKAKSAKEFRDGLSPSMQKAFDNMDEKERASFMQSRKSTGTEGDDPVAKALDSVTKENEKLTKRLATLERETELAKARVDLTDLAPLGKVNELAERYVRLKTLDADEAEAWLKGQRAAAAQLKEAGLFKILGGDGGDNTADAKIEAAAKALRTADPKLTKEQAVAKALEDNPELYDGYNTEHNTGRN